MNFPDLIGQRLTPAVRVITAEVQSDQERQSINEPRHEKTNNVDSDQVWHKPGCTATGDG